MKRVGFGERECPFTCTYTGYQLPATSYWLLATGNYIIIVIILIATQRRGKLKKERKAYLRRGRGGKSKNKICKQGSKATALDGKIMNNEF